MPYMTNEQAKEYNLASIADRPTLSVSDFSDTSDRTLVLGDIYAGFFDDMRMHVYLKNSEICVITYYRSDLTWQVASFESGTEFIVSELSPSDGCYPWGTDSEFARLMSEKQNPLALMDSTGTTPPRPVNGYLGGINP